MVKYKNMLSSDLIDACLLNIIKKSNFTLNI